MTRRPPSSPLFPYTTLFRSHHAPPRTRPTHFHPSSHDRSAPGKTAGARTRPRCSGPGSPTRSEEHTSELQSLRHLVCRLLLEKKKTTHTNNSRLTTHKNQTY